MTDDLVKCLRNRANGIMHWVTVERMVTEAADRIEALEAALRYYADEENWRGKFIYEQPGVIRHEGGFIRGDRGKIARTALGEKKDGN